MRNLVRAGVISVAALLATAPFAARAETLVIGSVGKDVKDELKEFTPLAIYLQERLASAGIDKVEVLVLPTAPRLIEAFRDGKVHLYVDSPLVATKVGREGGAAPLVRRWKKGVAEYWSEILVRADSPIQSLDDLRGHVIAFDDPDSTSGYLLPRAMLAARQLPVEYLKRSDQDFDRRKIGAMFAMGDRSSILQLVHERVDAIATDNQYREAIEKERPGSVRSIARSISVPRQVVMRATALPEPLTRTIADILVGMNQSEEGRLVLKLFGKTDRFDAFPQGIEQTFGPIEEQLRLLESDRTLAAAVQ